MDSEVTNLAFVKALAKGISDGNVLTANDVVVDNDFLRINGTEVEGLTVAEVLTALSVESGADVTDATNVTAAGALMDTECANVAAVKAYEGEAAATADQTADEIGALFAADNTTVQFGGAVTASSFKSTHITASGNISASLTSTGSFGQLMLNGSNFTSASLATAVAGVYTHPSYNGDDIDVDTTALTGATIVSDLDFNITTDSTGHVTDANGTVSTRTLTLANLGYTGDTDAADDQTAAEIVTLLAGDLGGDVSFGNQTSDSVTFAGPVVVTGDLTVNGTTTTIATSNTEIADQFIFLASGSAGTNVDAGIIVQSGSAHNSGSALYHDNSTKRWAVAKGIAKTATAAQTQTQFVATIKTSTSAPSDSDADYGVGEMWVETDTQDVYIRTA